jgi:Sec-independent protein translocase protein TatA
VKSATRVSRGFVPELAKAFVQGIKEFKKATINTSKEINMK